MSEQTPNLHQPTPRRTMSRRQALKLMGIGAGMATLAACVAPGGASETAGSEGAAPDAAPNSLTVVHRREYFKEMEDQFSSAVSNWGSENGVEMNVSTVASEAFEDFVAKLLAQVEAGNAPDLVYHRSNLVQLMYFQDALEPVTDATEQVIADYGAPASRLQKQMLIDGEWYGIPYIVAGGGKFARRSVYEAAGFDPLALNEYNQLRDATLAASDPSAEMYGWGMTVNQSGDGAGLITSVLHTWGSSITDADMTELTFNSPQTVDAVTWLSNIYTQPEFADMLPPGIVSWTDSSNNEAFLAGNIAVTQNAASVYAKAKADGNPVFEDTVVLPTTTGPTGEVLEGGDGAQFNIPRGAANVEGAKDLARHLLSPDIFLPISLISAGLFLPAYEDYYGMEEVVTAFEADPNLARMGEQALGSYPGLSYPAEPSPFFDAVNAQSIMTDMMSQIIAQGVSPEDAVAQATDRIAQLADELGVFA